MKSLLSSSHSIYNPHSTPNSRNHVLSVICADSPPSTKPPSLALSCVSNAYLVLLETVTIKSVCLQNHILNTVQSLFGYANSTS